jgi:hypothetical protein
MEGFLDPPSPTAKAILQEESADDDNETRRLSIDRIRAEIKRLKAETARCNAETARSNAETAGLPAETASSNAITQLKQPCPGKGMFERSRLSVHGRRRSADNDGTLDAKTKVETVPQVSSRNGCTRCCTIALVICIVVVVVPAIVVAIWLWQAATSPLGSITLDSSGNDVPRTSPYASPSYNQPTSYGNDDDFPAYYGPSSPLTWWPLSTPSHCQDESLRTLVHF